jgi:bifunctional non-homologous end joining protein LigD
MALEEYAAKRRFQKTPEPAPGPVDSARATNYFCVQRHDATRLHYDFRLEIDGVLKSWAVPKGPTLDPTVKHFAAHVEDHPVEYGDFEGTIPAGNYGAGSVMLWDRGSFELLDEASGARQLARGDLKFRLDGEKLKGDFAIVHMKGRGKGNEWLLIKKRDQFAVPGWDVEAHAYSVLSGRTQEEIARNLPARETKRPTSGASDRVWATSRPAKRATKLAKATTTASAAPPNQRAPLDPSQLKGALRAEIPAAIEPMMATLVERPPAGPDWLFEVKWDGVRALAFVDHEEVRLQSRSGLNCERQYPELAVIHHQITARQAVLDGEIAVIDPQGVSRFHLIQPRIANTDPNAIAHLVRSTPVVYFVFDLVYLDGYDLRNVALRERRKALEALIVPNGVLKVSAAFPAAGQEMLEAAREHGLEGIIAKHAASRYESKRSRDWLKIKIVTEQEFVIGGFTEPQGDRDYLGALVVGIYEDKKLRWVGNVGTGFDRKTLAELHRRLSPLATEACPFAERPKPDRGITWVRPELACQVKYANWTPDKHLRAPVYLGLRSDVDARQVSREHPEVFLTSGKEATCSIDGHLLKFTNLNKVFYPAEGYTKRDVLNYYAAIADLILPHLLDRPLSLRRYPNGIQGESFFQKNVPEAFASWLRTELIASDHTEKPINYVFAGDTSSLLYLVNLGCIDHNPWISRSPGLDHPDFVLIDLDPQECPFEMIVDAARLVNEVLDEIGLAGYPKTTGGDGMHVYVPVEPVYSYEDTRTFAELIARLAFDRNPDLFTTPRSVAKRRKRRVYFDYLQNAKSKTISAPYVLRAYPGAPVATPLEWAEVKRGLDPSQFHLANVRPRFHEKGDLFRGVLDHPQRLEHALGKLEKLFQKKPLRELP